MASVALTAHQRLGDRFDTHLVTGLPPEQPLKNLHEAGSRGDGLKHLAPEVMSGIVHIHGLWTPFELRAYRLAKARGAKIVVSPHGALEPWAFRSKRWKKLPAWYLYQKAMLQNADLLVASTQIEHDNFRNQGLTAPIAILPVGIDVGEHDAATSVAVGQDREKVVLFLSRLSEKKGIPDLLQAWHDLTDRRGHQLHIHGYGTDAYRTFLESLVFSLDLSDSVQILGPLFDEEKWEKYRTSSIYVLPSYSENFGITVAEALLSGLPAITTKATPWSEIVSVGIGWIINNDVAQLRRALEQAMSLDAEQISQMRERAGAYARSRFLWAPIIQQYAETYDWLLDPRRDMPSWVMRKDSRSLK